MHIYQRLKDLREDMDLKQEDVGSLLDITRQQYQLYESGKREIPLHKMIILADYYNVSLDYMAGRTNNKNGFSLLRLSDDELRILKIYGTLSERHKGRAEQFMLQLSKKTTVSK